MAHHTHVGRQSHVGYRHCSARLAGHVAPRAGRTHALVAGHSACYRALCGEVVRDDLVWSDEVDPAANVWACTAADAPAVTCERCLRFATAGVTLEPAR